MDTTDSMSSALAKLLRRTIQPTSTTSSAAIITTRNSTVETVSEENACTDWTRPERVMNVPMTTKTNDRVALSSAQPRIMRRRR